MTRIRTADPETDQRPTTQRIREGCWDLHQTAESGDFAMHMAKGDLGTDAYVAMLQALHEPMRVLDERLEARRPDVPAIAEVVTKEQHQAPNLAADLRHFGAEPERRCVGDAARALVDLVHHTEARNPAGLLGLHYVREGANNGNRFVAIKLRKGLGLEEGAGTSFLDPYGDQQRARWEAFKRTLDEQALEPAERDAMVEAAREMFRAIIDVHRELAARYLPANGG